jgi:sialate O-acetylesterase
MKKEILIILVTTAWIPAASAAEFAPVFTSGAVLQRESPVALWGKGRDGEKVTVEFLGQQVSAEVKEGRWRVDLAAMPANPGSPLTLRGDSEVTLQDVAVGEVWIGAGQSNMEWRLNQCAPHTDALLATADQPLLRQIKIPHRPYAGDPFPAFEWQRFDKAKAPFFSAVAYHFAARLQQKLDVPVGLVICTFGGTPIEAWMSREAMTHAGLQAALGAHDRKMAAFATPELYEAAWKEFQAAQKVWDSRKKAGLPDAELGPQPQEPYGYRYKRRPTGLRDSMLREIIPYTARGVLWYQGENNADKPNEYAALLPQLIAEWRSDWARPDWPFFVAQIASSNSKQADIEGWAVFREAQRAVATSTPNAGWVVTLDYGELGQVHPLQKEPIGERFARLALGKVYSQDVGTIQSPSAVKAVLSGNSVTVAFDELRSPLVIRDQALPALELQTAAGAWQAARAQLGPERRTLQVHVPPEAGRPQAVRYAWRQFCPLSIYTEDGLPVSPWKLAVQTSP